ncbi:leucyl aminopeptidase [Nocardioides panacis]|uniref:Probable cytosol aminopeptidase n=1 Tax=Nocardioides panacis TaxID=2849501 RepID=A0A975SVU9_9ACTN|nr:leucyl aminopeptidase [Nocardioides panacis]QWZ06405.1 leucyl aminopeptidase [Nocardioides panacis]
MTSYTLRKGAAEKTKADVVVIGVVRTPKGLRAAPGGEGVASAYGRKFAPLLSTIGFTAKTGEVAKVPTGGRITSPMLILVGLGEDGAVDATAVRRAAGAAVRAVSNAASVAVALPAADEQHVRAVVEGTMLGGYAFTAYKSGADPQGPADVVVLTDTARTKGAKAAVETARIVSEATALARDWVNTPPGDFTPEIFADAVVAEHKFRKAAKVKVSVLDDQQLRDGGFGGVVGVGQGSANPPRLVQLSYSPKGATRHLALVGKGITFDSGGLSIKPGSAMTTMKCDMAGAAAVVAATFAIAELGLPVRVTTVVPMAENMVSGAATRPGDVLTMYGGRTVEVLNTDAEGRLVLADGLVLANESKPDVLLDVATLTGACEVALGDRVTGIMGNDDELVLQTIGAGARAGEMLWQLPISAEMPVKVTTYSKVADLMQHNTDTFGGALYAAAFLQQFVGETRWAHLDIAGPGFNNRAPYGHVASGGTGASVATLVELATELSG